ncbi:dihydroxyacetone kinase subunit DhaL [Kitasatospora sp. NBC_01539]
MRGAAAAVAARQAELTALDAAIGDGDHGTNLHRGFTAVVRSLAADPPSSPGPVLSAAGSTLISTVGGACGPLYGSALRAVGRVLDAPQAGAPEVAAALEAALAAVQDLGGAQVGDKTMVDAFAPAVAAFRVSAGDGLPVASRAAADAARAGARATLPLVARKGRASYLGERSAGHLDPGAVSTALLFDALAEACTA